jgi:hypothetical protein
LHGPPKAPDPTKSKFLVGEKDLGLIIKTGYSTQDRLKAKLGALGNHRNASDVVLVSDYEISDGLALKLNGNPILLHDVISQLLKDGFDASPKMQQYDKLRESLKLGLSQTTKDVNGWEVDTLKVGYFPSSII